MPVSTPLGNRQQRTARRAEAAHWQAETKQRADDRAEMEPSAADNVVLRAQITVLRTKPARSPRRAKILQVSVFISYRASDSAWAA